MIQASSAVRCIYTIGYEGLTFGEFERILRSVDVTLLLDVRELPLSRKPGFSKTGLCSAVERIGIAYQHDRRLGAPKEIRYALKATGDWSEYVSHFEAYMDTRRDLIKVLAETLPRTVVLLCYEKDPKRCHRTIVARHLQEVSGAKVKHLGLDHAREATRPNLRTGKGLSAAK